MKSGKIFKLFTAVFFIINALSSFSEEESYQLQDKQVIWENKNADNTNVQEIKDISTKKETESVIVKENQQKEPEIKDIKTTPEDKKIEFPKEQPAENLIVTSNESRFKDNTILFGAGGYSKIDSFKYIINYTNEIKEKDFTYFIHLGRDINGEYRGNSDIGIDNYYGEIWYKKYNIGLYHLIKSYDYPGETTANSEVRSVKKEKSTELSFKYNAFSDSEKSLSGGFNFFNKNTTANPIEREYENNNIKFFINYDKIVEIDKYKNFLSATGTYFSDKINSKYFGNSDYGKTGAFRAVLEDKVKVKDLNDVTIVLNGGVEFASKKSVSNEKNFVLGVRGEKTFGENFGIAAEFKKDSMTLSNREIISQFEFDSDIMPFKELSSESDMKIELSGFCNFKNIFGEAKVRYMNSNDKVYFEEGTDYVALPNEREIYVKNYSNSLNWVELELKGSHTYKNYRTELKYTLSTLDEISYSPENKITTSLIYEYNKYKTYLDGIYFGKAYNQAEKDGAGNTNQRDTVGGAFTLDWKNSYELNEKTTVSFNILNIFDNEKEYKTNYPMPGRKIGVELKIKY